MVVSVDRDYPRLLAGLVGDERERERDWLTQARLERGVDAMKSAERRAALALLHAERAERRLAQEFLASRSAVVGAHLTRLLQAAGWAERGYPPVPAGQAIMPGRRWGTSRHAHHRGGPGRLTITLPDELGERIRRVSYWVSRRATAHLQRLADEGAGGFPPLPLLREMGQLAEDLHTVPLEDLAAAVRRRCRARPGPIVSTGDLVRAAAYRAAQFTPTDTDPVAIPTSSEGAQP